MHTVESCCCGCSLRTGTLIILYIPVVFWALLFGIVVGGLSFTSDKMIDFSSIMMIALNFALPFGIPTAAIYGVMQKKPSFMIPYLAFEVVSLVSMLFLMVIVPFFGAQLINFLTTMSIDDMNKSEILANGTGAMVCLEIVLLAIVALEYYLFVVVVSYYRELQREIKPKRQGGV